MVGCTDAGTADLTADCATAPKGCAVVVAFGADPAGGAATAGCGVGAVATGVAAGAGSCTATGAGVVGDAMTGTAAATTVAIGTLPMGTMVCAGIGEGNGPGGVGIGACGITTCIWAGIGSGACGTGVGTVARGNIASTGVPLAEGCTVTWICVPAGNGSESFTVSVSPPILSWVSPCALVPSTVASSTCPSFRDSASRLARTSCKAAPGVCGGVGCGRITGALIRTICRIRVNEP